MSKMRVMVCYGTRPEAVKMAPVVRLLRATPDCFEVVVVVTGQHRSMLDQINGLFGITPDRDLNIMSSRQSLEDITVKVLAGLNPIISEVQPDVVLVQGDTTSTFAAALAAFYAQVPVAHLEAGLRTDHRYDPFPEEINRRLTGQLTSLHFPPTSHARQNLMAEGVDPRDVFVTGNTVIDALHQVLAENGRSPSADEDLRDLGIEGADVLTVTLHRRESLGEPMANVARAIAQLARDRPQLRVVMPLHKNPAVRDVVVPILGGLPNVRLLEPLSYLPFARLLATSRLVLTDSGGVQEEAPSLGVPVLVARRTTERPEAVAAGTAQLVGTDQDDVVGAVAALLDDQLAHERMARAVNPYGDGRAAERVAAALSHALAGGPSPSDFVAEDPGRAGA